MFDITHLVVFDYFACDLERPIIELPVSQGTALVKAKTALEDSKASLDGALVKSKQLKHELISTRLKQKLKEEELEKEKEMFKRSTVMLGRQKDELERKISTLKGTLCKEHLDTIDKAVEGYQEVVTFFEGSGLLEEKLKMSIDEKFRQLAIEKKDEVDSMLKVLRTKQEELEGNDFLPLILERDKREAALKEENATLKTTLEEKELQLKNTFHQKDAQLRDLHAELKQQHTLLQQQKAQLKQKDAELRHNDEESGRQYAVLLHEYQQLQQERYQLRCERDQLQRESSRSLSAKPVVKEPPRNWKDMKCQKILKCGFECRGLATKGNHITVGVPHSIKVYDRSSTDLLHTIGKDRLGRVLNGVTFYDQEHILVSDYSNSNIKVFTIQGQHVRTIDRGSTTFKPCGITISPDGHIYVCDVANHCVCVFNVNGKFLFSFGSRGSDDECFDQPRDLCFASDGFLYITDVNNSRICVCDKDGYFYRNFTTTYEPYCIDATDCGHLIVSSFLSHNVMKYTTGGDLVHVFGEHGSELGQFDHPFGVSVDSDGLIYIADYGNHRIQVF